MLALWSSASLFLSGGCHSNSLTANREPFITVPEEQEQRLGTEIYRKLLQSPTLALSYDGRQMDLINKTASKLIRSANQSPSHAGKAFSYEWESVVVKDDASRSVIVLPGGKIIASSGLLLLFPTEEELAPVLGHAMAHALAGHGGERIGRNVLTAVGSDMAGVVIQKRQAKTTRPAMAALGFGPWIGVDWPYSEAHETEADRIGLALATRAGYDPAVARLAWNRLKAHSGEWASLHPWSTGRAELWAALISRTERFDGRADIFGLREQ
jgi:predicted Zn-dependent protease